MEKNQYNENGEQHGYWESYWSNGTLSSKGNYINGKQDGYWESYHYDGELYEQEYFIN